MLQVSRIEDLNCDDIGPLLSESSAEGYQFVARLREEWADGANRFDKPGEILLGASEGGHLVGVCGLNLDPYISAQGVGRLRHLFVARRARGGGVGRELVTRICETGSVTFERVRLRAAGLESREFYPRLGFESVCGDAYCTHQKWLRARHA